MHQEKVLVVVDAPESQELLSPSQGVHPVGHNAVVQHRIDIVDGGAQNNRHHCHKKDT